MPTTHQSDSIERIADLIRCYSTASSEVCCEVLEVLKIPVTAGLINVFMAEAMAFFFSVSQCELMMRRGGSTKEDYQQTEREIRIALSNLGLKHEEFFPFAMFPTDDRFEHDVYRYYRGCMADFGLSDLEIQDFAHKFILKKPVDGSFGMAVFIFNFCMIKICRLRDKVSDLNVECVAARKIIEQIGKFIAEFLDLVRDCLNSQS